MFVQRKQELLILQRPMNETPYPTPTLKTHCSFVSTVPTVYFMASLNKIAPGRTRRAPLKAVWACLLLCVRRLESRHKLRSHALPRFSVVAMEKWRPGILVEKKILFNATVKSHYLAITGPSTTISSLFIYPTGCLTVSAPTLIAYIFGICWLYEISFEPLNHLVGGIFLTYTTSWSLHYFMSYVQKCFW